LIFLYKTLALFNAYAIILISAIRKVFEMTCKVYSEMKRQMAAGALFPMVHISGERGFYWLDDENGRGLKGGFTSWDAAAAYRSRAIEKLINWQNKQAEKRVA
jgi:hypothetical protein